jgi:nucleoid DNA-binding protein
VRDKRARNGRNPQTGAPVTIARQRVVRFKGQPVLAMAEFERRRYGI